jgi:tetratricopeptide (TPR) repeat protein
MRSLDDEIHARIARISEEGNALANAGDLEGALQRFRAALELLPAPRESWEAAHWLLTAIGDVLFLQGRFAEALAPLQQSVAAGGLGNPFVHLRLGQVQLELGNRERAADELARAYMGAGDEIFESEDPKYRRLVRETLRSPAEGAKREGR